MVIFIAFAIPRYIFDTMYFADREVYFAGQCNIKFKHSQSDVNLLKVVLFPNSCCMVHKSFNEWTAKVIVQWQRHCEKNGIACTPSAYPGTSKVDSGPPNYKSKRAIETVADVDMYSVLQNTVAELLEIEKKYAKNVLAEESLLSKDLLNELQSFGTLGEADKDRFLVNLQKMSDRIKSLKERALVEHIPIRPNDSVMSLDSNYEGDNNSSSTIPISSRSGTSGRVRSPFSSEKYRPEGDTSSQSSLFLSDQEYVQSVFRSSKSQSDFSRVQQSYLNRSLDSTESLGSQSYGYIMNSIPLSESMSSMGEPAFLEESESMKHLPPLEEKEEKEDMDEKEDVLSFSQNTPSVLQISTNNLPTNPRALAILFNIESEAVFDGGISPIH